MHFLLVNSYHPARGYEIQQFERMLAQAGTCRTVPESVLSLDDDIGHYDAVVLSGSGDMISRGAYRSRFLDWLRTNRRPVLGVCYGHQLLALAFGAQVRTGPLVRGLLPVRRRAAVGLLAGFESTFYALQSHREYVDPASLHKTRFHPLASSDTCPVEAIAHERFPFFGVQFHPERTPDVARRIMGNFVACVKGAK